jgi:uncharacterized protein
VWRDALEPVPRFPRARAGVSLRALRGRDRDRAPSSRLRAGDARRRAAQAGDRRPDRGRGLLEAGGALTTAAEIRIRLQARARRTEIAGERAGALLVRVSAPPVDGRANAALCSLVAELAGVPRSCVTVVRGAASRDKIVRVEGIEPAALRAALGL